LIEEISFYKGTGKKKKKNTLISSLTNGTKKHYITFEPKKAWNLFGKQNFLVMMIFTWLFDHS